MNADPEGRYLQALHLLGNYVRFTDSSLSIGRRCVRIYWDGMVELEGLNGRFSPWVLKIDGELQAVPVMGWVN